MKPLNEVLEDMRQRNMLIKDLYGLTDEEIEELEEFAVDVDEEFKKFFSGELSCTEVSLYLAQRIGIDITSEKTCKITMSLLVLINGLKAGMIKTDKKDTSNRVRPTTPASRIPPGFGS